jgi:MinD-like ATPase involved in chromosome partitioning or flagellar assembly
MRSGRPHSALLIDGDVTGLDRDMLATAHEWDCAVVVVDGRRARGWMALGADAVVAPPFSPSELVSVLAGQARELPSAEIPVIVEPGERTAPWSGVLIAVSGRAGSGASTLAAGLAQSFAAEPRNGGLVLLADLALDADQALLHDAVDVVPGLQELVEAHRTSTPSIEQVRAGTFLVAERRYDLLLGLRRHHDWVALRPRALVATIDSLRLAYRVVVADCDADLEGEALTGSVDIDERNTAARAASGQADVVVAVGAATLTGLHGLVRHLDALLAHGVQPERIVTVVNRAPRSRRRRAEAAAALAALVDRATGIELGEPVFVVDRSGLDDTHRGVVRLPAGLAAGAHRAVLAALGGARPGQEEPVPVAPGSIGHLGGDLEV